MQARPTTVGPWRASAAGADLSAFFAKSTLVWMTTKGAKMEASSWKVAVCVATRCTCGVFSSRVACGCAASAREGRASSGAAPAACALAVWCATSAAT